MKTPNHEPLIEISWPILEVVSARMLLGCVEGVNQNDK